MWLRLRHSKVVIVMVVAVAVDPAPVQGGREEMTAVVVPATAAAGSDTVHTDVCEGLMLAFRS
jgi:hypothetical protein